MYRDILDGVSLDRINVRMLDEYRSQLSIVTDNHPFFNDLTPIANYTDPTRWFGGAALTAPWVITKRSIAFAFGLTLVSTVLILGPLLLRAGPKRTRSNVIRLGYFLAVGVGFMLIEVGMIRKLSRVLGHPSYSISIVLAALILSTGLGSLASGPLFARRVLDEKKTVVLILVYVAIFWASYASIFPGLIRLEGYAKFAAVIAILTPLGFLMGQLFPQGLVRAGAEDPHLVPWAWAINGTASTAVVGFAAILSYPLGFDFLLVAGAAVYGCVLLLPLGRSQPSGSVAA